MPEVLQTFDNVKWLSTEHTFNLVSTTELPDLPKTQSVFMMAFEDENILLANVHGKGWDIPGGHIEGGETPEEAIVRIMFEETGASLLVSGLLGYVEITLHGDKPTSYPYAYPTTYMPIYWGMVNSIAAPSSSMGVGAPKLFPQHKVERNNLLPYHMPFYEQALARTQVFLQAMANAG
jgi:ADP-ribose pyrophosphatase YjhB (NUDIX family)